MYLFLSCDLVLNSVIEMQLTLLSYWLSLCDDATQQIGLIYGLMVWP